MHIQRRRHTDGYKIHIFYKGKIGSGAERTVPYQLRQLCIDHIADIVVSGIHQFHFFFLHVEADSPETCLGFLYGKGQAHIAQAHDAYRDFSFRNTGKEFFFHYCLFFRLKYMQPAYTARMAGGYSATSQYQREMRIITPTPASVFMK